jgi:hypothetical protein
MIPLSLRRPASLVLAAFFFLLAPPAFSLSKPDLTPQERFSKATQAFDERDYAEAAYQLRELSAAGQWSHGALHNLGNAEWKVVRPGYAVLAWERARTLDPTDRNTIANLRFARTQARLIQPSRPWYEQFSEWLPASIWLCIAGISLWGGIALLSLPRLLGWRRAGWHQGAAALLLAAFLLSTPALYGLYTRSLIGVALDDETSLRLTPTREGEELIKIPAGELARIERERGNYYYIRAEGDRAGWVEKRVFAKIWP